MTGFVEAATVLGFISAITGICDAAHQVYEAYVDKSGLPRKFRASADQLPLICHALDLAHANITTGNVEQGSRQVALPVLNRCKEEAVTVKAIFDKCLSTKDARRRERLFGAVNTLRKGGELSENMEIIVKNLELLAQHQIFQDSDTIQKLAAAVQRLETSHTRHLGECFLKPWVYLTMLQAIILCRSHIIYVNVFAIVVSFGRHLTTPFRR